MQFDHDIPKQPEELAFGQHDSRVAQMPILQVAWVYIQYSSRGFMRKIWIVVANNSQAIIYRAENVNTLIEHKVFEHKESHLTDSDLIADRQGRQTHRGIYGTDTFQEQTTTKAKESSAFARQIASFIEEGFNSGAFERIYLVVKSPFLGFLHQSLSSNVNKLIEKEIHKDLTHLEAKKIREYLPPVL